MQFDAAGAVRGVVVVTEERQLGVVLSMRLCSLVASKFRRSATEVTRSRLLGVHGSNVSGPSAHCRGAYLAALPPAGASRRHN